MAEGQDERSVRSRFSEQMHRFYRGKIQIQPKCAIRDHTDLAVWYTPGVLAACQAIARDPQQVYEQTNRWNTVALVTNGSRLLGLGNLGPEAALPAMEGKALLLKYLGGVDAVPVCLDAHDPEDLVRTTRHLQPSFGGVSLEGIASPACFYVLDRLREDLVVPAATDHQATAIVTLAALLNALRVVGKSLPEVRIALVGAGGANLATAQLLIAAGATPGHLILVDRGGILNRRRVELREAHREKWTMCLATNAEGLSGGIPEALRGADVVIARSAAGLIRQEWVRRMAEDAIVFACALPEPEIGPEEARAAGARIVASAQDGFPNPLSDALAFPPLFRGALDVRAWAVTAEMCIAAAEALAEYAARRGLDEEAIVPHVGDEDVYPEVAAAVGLRAITQGVSRLRPTREQLVAGAREAIRAARESTRLLMEHGLIPILHPPA
jgi:malate dehydrogenase (oxaloacetate-decarboxylating)